MSSEFIIRGNRKIHGHDVTWDDFVSDETTVPADFNFRLIRDQTTRANLAAYGRTVKTNAAPAQSDGTYWCNSHQREATHVRADGTRCCDPKLGGILLPCAVVLAPMKVTRA